MWAVVYYETLPPNADSFSMEKHWRERACMDVDEAVGNENGQHMRVRMETCLINAQTQAGEKSLFASQTFHALSLLLLCSLSLAFLCIAHSLLSFRF